MENEKEMSVENQELLFGEFGLKRYVEKIKEQLVKYMDIKEEYYDLIALWIAGTYLHSAFTCYPYLFIHGMKSSGKSRLQKIIAYLSRNGAVVGCMSEAVMFRTAKGRTLCVDEFENASDDDKKGLLLLFNSAYKKGLCVERLVKKKKLGEETYDVERFDVFCPVCISSIKNMNNVLNDRAVVIILEKSGNKAINRLTENFDRDAEFIKIRGGLKRITEGLNEEHFDSLFNDWNEYICNPEVSQSKFKALFDRIEMSGIDGRNLELFLPLFILADICSEDLLNKIILTAMDITQDKKEEDLDDNLDIQVYDFVAQYPDTDKYAFIDDLLKEFRLFADNNEEWLNNKVFGKKLKKLGLIKHKKKISKVLVLLDVKKAQDKMKMFS